MANDLLKFKEWTERNAATLPRILTATYDLVDKLSPKAAAANKSVADLVNDDAVTVRALLDGAGLAAIAGAHGVSVEQIMEGLGQVLGIASLVMAIA